MLRFFEQKGDAFDGKKSFVLFNDGVLCGKAACELSPRGVVITEAVLQEGQEKLLEFFRRSLVFVIAEKEPRLILTRLEGFEKYGFKKDESGCFCVKPTDIIYPSDCELTNN